MQRIVEISGPDATVALRVGNLVIGRPDRPDAHVPICDVAAVVLADPRVTVSPGSLRALAEAGCGLVVVDERYLPVAVLQPLQGHHVQTERVLRQAGSKPTLRKRLWQQVVRSKVRAQAARLVELHGTDSGVGSMAARVRSGDPDNVEAQAARRYWPLLFADEAFRRDVDARGTNQWLNYGYAVVRAAVARAVCAAGLHPSLGLHHRNRYNTFCLADDLMEPFRPHVDGVVASERRERGELGELDAQSKAFLIPEVLAGVRIDGEVRSLADAAAMTATSLAQVFVGERASLVLPGS